MKYFSLLTQFILLWKKLESGQMFDGLHLSLDVKFVDSLESISLNLFTQLYKARPLNTTIGVTIEVK